MPRGDGTGPLGQGPGMGRGMGRGGGNRQGAGPGEEIASVRAVGLKSRIKQVLPVLP